MSASNDPTGGMQNGFDPRAASNLSAHEQALVERRQRLLGPAYKLMYQHPVELVRGDGVHLFDPQGQAYLDCYNNVVSVGHCNPHVVKAVKQQLATLNTHTRYLNDQILDYAERLLDTFEHEPELHNGRVMFACTGSEANDLAVRMAKHYTGGTGWIVTDNAYHGTTELIASLSPSMGLGTPLNKDARTVTAPDTYRLPLKNGQVVATNFAEEIEVAIKDMQQQGIKFAGLLVDTIFSSDGLFPPTGQGEGFLQAAVDVVHKHGGLFVADEVQPGFGRTGSQFWGFQHHGVQPDLVTMGKPMGNGIPVAGCVARAEVADHFGQNVRYFNTFGGNPVSITAARATLDEVLRLMPQAAEVGAYTLAGLEKLKQKYRCIGDVRGLGQYFAVEFVRDSSTKQPDANMAKMVVNEMRERRVLISTTSKPGNSLKIRPLLAFTKEHADQFLSALDGAISHLALSAPSAVTSDPSAGAAGSVLETKVTPVSEEEAKQVLSRDFGLIPSKAIKRLIGERDDNFCVVTASGQRYVIKFVHPSEPEETTGFQTSIMHYLNKVSPHLPIARVIDPLPSYQGDKDSEGHLLFHGRAVRVVTFLDGVVLCDAPRTPLQAYNIGRIGAQISLALKSFSHPGQEHELLWDSTRVSQMRKYMDALAPGKREEVEKLIANYETRVAPHLARGDLEISVVHNDLNASNILVKAADPTQVAGIIDWGDAIRAPVVQDAAVGAVYSFGIPGKDKDWVERGLAFLKGYHAKRAFTPLERELLFDFILARFALRLVIPTWRALRFPENEEYIHRNTKNAWEQLHQLLALPDGRRTFALCFS